MPILNNQFVLYAQKYINKYFIGEKGNAPGHIYRHTLVKHILKSNLPIDIYGCGCQFSNKLLFLGKNNGSVIM